MELELKFALPAPDPQQLERQLRRSGVMGRRKPTRQLLQNTYYDTPDHALQQQRVALRVRQIGSDAQPVWVQTLKTGGQAGSALSRRGEWEQALPDARLDRALLEGTPWAELDPQGAWFDALVPVFSTTFERLSWVVQGEGFSVEVALDRGEVQMDGHSTPLCELEIELLSGPPEALFDTAGQIARHLALLPLHMSKAERAYRLAQGTLYAPLRAQPPALVPSMGLEQLAGSLLRECFLQFTANLNSCRSSHSPELLHQARVGWRRFKSALKLLQLDQPASGRPDLAPLQPLLRCMAALRDLDVCADEVLAPYALPYQGESQRRARHWARLEAVLEQARAAQRQRLYQQLVDPALGRTLLLLTRWLETGALSASARVAEPAQAAAQPLRKRLARQAKKLQALARQAPDAAAQHRLRMRAKRLRYSVESLRALLPKKRARRWHQLALALQTRIGQVRDRQVALALAERLRVPEGIVEFVRGAQFSDKTLRPFP